MNNPKCCPVTARGCKSDACFNYSQDIECQSEDKCGGREYSRDTEFDVCDGLGMRKRCIIRKQISVIRYACPTSGAYCHSHTV